MRYQGFDLKYRKVRSSAVVHKWLTWVQEGWSSVLSTGRVCVIITLICLFLSKQLSICMILECMDFNSHDLVNITATWWQCLGHHSSLRNKPSWQLTAPGMNGSSMCRPLHKCQCTIVSGWSRHLLHSLPSGDWSHPSISSHMHTGNLLCWPFVSSWWKHVTSDRNR